MQSTNTSETKNGEYIYCRHLVGFLDLLGQKENLESIEGILDRQFTRDELLHPLSMTVGAIRDFRRHFRTTFDSFANRELPAEILLESLSSEQKAKFLKLRRNSKLGIQQFSDSVVFWTPVQIKDESDLPQILNSISAAFVTTALAIPTFMARGVPIRGAIEMEGGILIEPDGEEIYGPALNTAYKLECAEAKYPRVILGPKISMFLDQIPNFAFQDEHVRELSINAARRCKACLFLDSDGYQAIHFLSTALKILLPDSTEQRNYIDLALEPARKFALESQNKFPSGSILFHRYRKLSAYFDEHMKAWEN